MNQMKGLLHLLAIWAISMSMAGCQEKRGGGLGSGKFSKSYVYGWSEEQLEFVIFADIEGIASAGSSWTGYIKSKEGLTLNYQGDADGVVIDGTRHEFTKGRIFLVATKSGTTVIEQLDLPIQNAHYKEELSAVKQRKEIQDFFSR